MRNQILMQCQTSEIKTIHNASKFSTSPAKGIAKNYNAGVNYSQNAEYSEGSKQQSIQSAIEAKGGVDKAIKIDTTGATIKAKVDVSELDAKLKASGAKNGLGDSDKNIASAMDTIAKTAGSLAKGKSAADMESIERAGGDKGYVARMKRQAANKMSDTIATQDQYIAAYNKEEQTKQIASMGTYKPKLYDPKNPEQNKAELNKYVEGTEFNKAVVTNAIPETMTVGGTAGTALLGAATVGFFGSRIAKPVWKALKSFKPEDPVPNKTSSVGSGKNGDIPEEPFDKKHGNSFRKDMKHYIEEYGKNKEAFKREDFNKRELEQKRNNILSKDPAASTEKLDYQIKDSKTKLSEYQTNMDKAHNGFRNAKNAGIKEMVPKASRFSKIAKFGGKRLVELDAVMSAVDAKEQFDQGNTTAGLLSATQSVTALAFSAKPGLITGAAYTFSSAANIGYNVFSEASKAFHADSSVLDGGNICLVSMR